MEIERKYVVSKLPGDLATYPSKKIEQGYLCGNPTIRIRKSNEDYYLTYKSKMKGKQTKGAAIIRNEVELPLTKEAYETLKAKIEGNMVCKTRYLIPLENGLTAELDIFEGLLAGLMMAEVEFPDEEAANQFIPPDWMGKDLSADKRYSNYRMSKLSSCDELLY